MISTVGKVEERPDGTWIKTTRPPEANIAGQVVVMWPDARKISAQQRKRAWALIGEISSWSGYEKGDKDLLNMDLKRKFLTTYVDELTADAIKKFSLGDCDMTVGRLYNAFLTDFIIEHGVPTKFPLYEMIQDSNRYVYSCLMHKRCAVCGRKADLHHVDRVGMGRNRNDIVHIGSEVLPLCREHHTECHTMAQTEFDRKYHLDGSIFCDKAIAKVYHLRTTEKRRNEK